MKKILISLGVIGVVAATVIASSGAFFSANTTSHNNTIQTASMTMSIDHTGYPTEMRILDGRNMYPGAFVQSAVEIHNSGSVAFNPELVLNNANNDKGINQYLWFEVWTNGKLWFSGPITDFPGYNASAHVILDKVAAGSSETVAFRAILQETATEAVAGGTYMVDLNVTGHQWNDSNYQPTTPKVTNAGYVVNTWSYNVCGVRPANFWPPLAAGDTYAARGYNYTSYSPFFSYIVNTPMANNNDLWAVQTLPNSYYQGFVDAAEGYCTLTDQAPTPVPPTIDGVISPGEWDGATVIDFAGGKGTASVLAYSDYMYVLYQVHDSTNARLGQNTVGNDQLGININPASDNNYGKPYNIVFQTGNDPAAFTTPDPNTDNSSSGPTDGWASEWVTGNAQSSLPASVETRTVYSGGVRITEWRFPLSSITGLTTGSILKVGGSVDIGDGNPYSFPPTLDWSHTTTTFVDVQVK